MRLVFQVLRKDARRLRWPAALCVGLVCGWAGVEGLQSDASPGWVGAALQPLVSLAWMFLVAQVVQEEALAGDRQYWLTRPYSRAGLALSKALFVLVFVHGPYLLACTAILAARGFAPWNEWGALWERQAMVAALITIPCAAVAAVTRTFAQFCGGMFVLVFGGLVVVATGQLYAYPWIAVDVVRRLALAVLLASAGLTVLALQYRTRKTGVAGALGASAAVGAGLMFAWIPGVYTEGLRCGPIAGQAPALEWVKAETPDPLLGSVWGRDMFSAPVVLRNVGQDLVVRPRTLSLEVEAADGGRWKSGKVLAGGVEIRPGADRLRLFLDRPVAERLRGQRVEIQGVLKLDVSKQKAPVAQAIEGDSQWIPWMGRCRNVIQDGGRQGREMLKVFCESPRDIPLLAKVLLRDEGGEVWEQALGNASVHYSGLDWLSPLVRKQTFFPIVAVRFAGSGNKWLVPRDGLQRAMVELMPEEPAGCAIVPFAVAGRLDHAAGRFWPVMERK